MAKANPNISPDPVSRVASWLESKQEDEKPATAEELAAAAIEFEAIDVHDLRIFKGRSPEEDFMFRTAIAFLAKSKPDLVRVVGELVADEDGRALFEYERGLDWAQKCVAEFAELLSTAHARLLCAAAAFGWAKKT
jgi:hypothetical protein